MAKSWLTCRHCHHPLVPVSVVQGQTCIIMGQVVVKKAAVVCGKCGVAREFNSAAVDAEKLPAPLNG